MVHGLIATMKSATNKHANNRVTASIVNIALISVEVMKKSELLRALQFEIQKHNLSTFMDENDKIVITGCTLCRKHFGTVEQFKRHITDDVLPPLLDTLSVETK